MPGRREKQLSRIHRRCSLETGRGIKVGITAGAPRNEGNSRRTGDQPTDWRNYCSVSYVRQGKKKFHPSCKAQEGKVGKGNSVQSFRQTRVSKRRRRPDYLVNLRRWRALGKGGFKKKNRRMEYLFPKFHSRESRRTLRS